MLEHPYTTKQIWATVQETPRPSYSPAAYMLLLSAIDNGWQVGRIELMPSWDQHGFIYLVTLDHPMQKYHQQLILPKNAIIESLLFEHATCFHPAAVRSYPMVRV
jgi:hypothetical protein